ncbi:MAG: GspH/FimT family pseudopilin [Xanthomonadales bacterium]|nr:GspH/FimT family pseudopilin [Xanthomonadales bacterium]
MRRNAARCQGFTLLELMTTLSVVVIVISIGIPSFQTFMAAQQLKVTHNRLFGHLSLARLTAVTEGRRAVLCPSIDGQTCSGATDWAVGWIVFVDATVNRVVDPGDRIVHRGTAMPPGVSLTTSRARRAISFLPSGYSPGSNLTFALCHDNPKVPPKAIILSNQGRPRASDTRPGGRPILC